MRFCSKNFIGNLSGSSFKEDEDEESLINEDEESQDVSIYFKKRASERHTHWLLRDASLTYPR